MRDCGWCADKWEVVSLGVFNLVDKIENTCV